MSRDRAATVDSERRALDAAPYETDTDLSWQAPPGPELPYDGEVPAEVEQMVAARRKLLESLRPGQER